MEQAECQYISYGSTGRFGKLVADYADDPARLSGFLEFLPDGQGLRAAIEARRKFPVDRQALVKALHGQYGDMPRSEAVSENITALAGERAFTVCTAHQPNLATGYLYFAYKILHTVALCRKLRELYPEETFIPVYYLGSEDNDLEELGTFRYGSERFVWDGAGQQGAVGNMKPEGILPLLERFFAQAGPPGAYFDRMRALLTAAYKLPTITAATRYLVNGLFGEYGVVVADANDPLLKRALIPVFRDELLHRQSTALVAKSVEGLEAAGYKSQAAPREINLFYLVPGLRERIVAAGDGFETADRSRSWSREAILQELEAHPERFSPNVILRGLLQESVLPNIAFIGGGSEIAYWMQLRDLFRHYHVFFPVLVLRQSVQLLTPEVYRRLAQADLRAHELFQPEEDLIRLALRRKGVTSWNLDAEQAAVSEAMAQLRSKAAAADPTLEQAAQSITHRMETLVQSLSQKIYRAEKRRHADTVGQVRALLQAAFPGGQLQERYANLFGFWPQYGPALLDRILAGTLPLESRFLLLSADPALFL